MDKKTLVIAALLLIWVFTTVSFYFVAHKPLPASSIEAVIQASFGLVGASLVIALGAGIGLVSLPEVGLRPVDRLIWATGLGMGVVSLLSLGLGALGLLRPWLLWVLTALGLAVAFRPLLQSMRDAWADITWHPHSRFAAFLTIYCAAMLLLALARALTPPTAWDSLVYHMTGPKHYLAEGHISHSIDLPYLGFPQMTEMLFTWAVGLAGERAAATVHWWYGVLAGLTLVSAGRQLFGDVAGWLAAALLLSARTVALLASRAYVDLSLLFYATLAFLALLRWIEGGGRRWQILSGVATGLALSTKYTALAIVPALVAALIVARRRLPRPLAVNAGATILDGFLLVSVSLVVWSPWLLKNLLLTSNPIYPFFLDGVYWDSWRASWFDRPGSGLFHTAPWKLLTAPWDATIWGLEGGVGYSATVGPLLLAMLPLLALVWSSLSSARRRRLQPALAFCSVLYGFWLWGIARTALLHQTRLLFPAFGVLALVAGATVHGLKELAIPQLELNWLMRTVSVCVLTLTAVGMFVSTVEEQPLQVLLGFESRDDFLARRLGWYYVAVEYINQQLPADSVIVFLWEPRSYHCARDCRPDALLDRWLHMTYLHGQDAESIAATWRAQGFTHVLLHTAGLEYIVDADFDPVTAVDLQTLDDLNKRHARLVESFGSAYELRRLEHP